MADSVAYISTESRELTGSSWIKLMQEMLAKGDRFRFKAGGLSMYPYIKDGDTITVEILDRASIRIGDIVAYLQPESEKLVIHRLLRKSNSSFYLKGDNSDSAGRTVPVNRVIASVKAVERRGERVTFGFGPEKLPIAILLYILDTSSFLRPLVSRLLNIFKKFAR